MSYWRGKRAVVIGGSAGLGRAIAASLVRHEARVAIVARRQAPLEAAVADLQSRGAAVLGIAADVTQPEDVRRVVATVHSAWGGADLVCHCAGRSMRGTALGTSPDDYRALWETNFLSAVRCAQAFRDALAGSRGHLVLIGSLASKVASGYLGAYPSSKFPLAALAQQLRLEARQQGFHVLLVCPGPIQRGDDRQDSGRYAGQGAEVPEAAQRPGGGAKVRALDPDWLAERILHACQQHRPELVVPRTARLLFAIAQLSPRLGDWLLRRLTASQ